MISLFAVPPSVQAVFDALKAVLAEDPTRVNVSASTFKDAGGSNSSITIVDKYGSQATYTVHVTTGRVFVEPMAVSLGQGETVQFSATTLDDGGQPVPATVTWALQSGAIGSVDATGLYTAPATITGQFYEYLTAKDAAEASATVSITLHP